MLKHRASIIHELNHNYYWWNHVIFVRHRIDIAIIILLFVFGIFYMCVDGETRRTMKNNTSTILLIIIMITLIIPCAQSLTYIIPRKQTLSNIEFKGYLNNTSWNTSYTFRYDNKKSIKELPTLQKESKKLKVYHRKLINDDYYTVHLHPHESAYKYYYYNQQYKKYDIKYQKLRKQFKHNQYALHFIINFKAPHLIL